MRIVNCPECGTKISDKAISCPFCGYRKNAKNMPKVARNNSVERISFESHSKKSDFDQIFPISEIQSNNLYSIFCKAENLLRVAPSFFETIKAMIPQTIKIAETNNAIQELINSGVYRFITDRNGEILPCIIGEKGIVAQVRLKDLQITPDLGSSIIDLQTQVALAQVISEIRDVQRSIENLHSELQGDRLALADSAWQQLQQAVQINDGRVREEKYLRILGVATDAKCTLFRAFASEKNFFDKKKDKNWFLKIVDKEAQNKGDEKSSEIFACLLAITKAVHVEVTVYCLLGERNAAILSMKQFSDFIRENALEDRETLLNLNSYSSLDQKNLIGYFSDISQKISSFPLDARKMQPVTPISNIREER